MPAIDDLDADISRRDGDLHIAVGPVGDWFPTDDQTGVIRRVATAMIGDMAAPPTPEMVAEHQALFGHPPHPLFWHPDDPDMDATDFAHPAFWRGHDHGFAGAVRAVAAVLDGDDNGSGVAAEPWERVRRRLLALVAKAGGGGA